MFLVCQERGSHINYSVVRYKVSISVGVLRLRLRVFLHTPRRELRDFTRPLKRDGINVYRREQKSPTVPISLKYFRLCGLKKLIERLGLIGSKRMYTYTSDSLVSCMFTRDIGYVNPFTLDK